MIYIILLNIHNKIILTYYFTLTRDNNTTLNRIDYNHPPIAVLVGFTDFGTDNSLELSLSVFPTDSHRARNNLRIVVIEPYQQRNINIEHHPR